MDLSRCGSSKSLLEYLTKEATSLASYSHTFDNTKTNYAKSSIGIGLGILFTTPVHELAHKLTADLFGYHSKIHLGRFFGGDFLETAFPNTFHLDPTLFSAYTIGDPRMNLHGAVISMAPYPLQSSIGFYLIHDGVRRKSPVEIGAGLINIVSPLPNFSGDFLNMTYRVTDYLYNGMSVIPNNVDLSITENIFYGFLGACVVALYFYKTSKFIADLYVSEASSAVLESTDENPSI